MTEVEAGADVSDLGAMVGLFKQSDASRVLSHEQDDYMREVCT